ncbi:MAG: iron-sulfur cluster assembly accessory protein [Bacteroidota bacterium]
MNDQQEQTAVQEINITPEAAKEIIKIRAENKIPESHALRMGVREGGCCGISYVLGFEEKAQEADKIFQAEGITVYVDATSLPHLSGATLEFVSRPNGSGFKFDNPNDQKSSGCSDCGDGGCCG